MTPGAIKKLEGEKNLKILEGRMEEERESHNHQGSLCLQQSLFPQIITLMRQVTHRVHKSKENPETIIQVRKKMKPLP